MFDLKAMLRCRKRPKRDENNAVKDRISNLPDHVLLDNILSYLPTKDVVATSLLSRRWRRLFTGVTRLDCDDSPISHCAEHPHLTELFPTFKMFVDNMLQASEGVKKLDIHIRVREPDKLPSAIFNCRTLEVLKLDVNLDLEVPSTLCLPNLKELHISVVCFPIDDSLTRLVSSCPSLEYMTLCGSLSPVIPISISSHSLRTLKLNTFFCSSILGSKLVLDVPNLEYLCSIERAKAFLLVKRFFGLNAEERHCEIHGRLLYTAKLVAKQEGLNDGFRIVINDGPKGSDQSVYHIH
uniref:F-box domain-containing protein n=1 Tax=Chenopodium quinoa TaxID=63459 RepID=A0A803LZF4_CHEQI